MPATKRGVYHNIMESKYTVSNSEIVFFFSSVANMRKFLIGIDTHRDSYRAKMAKIVDVEMLNMDMLADISLYRRVEKRGFRAWIMGVDITCQDLYQYACRRMTKPNTLDWQEIQKPKLAERKRSLEST